MSLNFGVLSWTIARQSPEAMIVFARLLDLEDWFNKFNQWEIINKEKQPEVCEKIANSVGIFQSVEKLSEYCGIERKKVIKAIKFLEKNKYIRVERRGIPRKNYYYITTKIIDEITENNHTKKRTASSPKTGLLEVAVPKDDCKQSQNGTAIIGIKTDTEKTDTYTYGDENVFSNEKTGDITENFKTESNEKTKNNDNKDIILYFKNKFEMNFNKANDKTAIKYVINWGKEMKLASKLQKTYNPAEIKELIDCFFNNLDKFSVNNKVDFGIFYSQINKIVSVKGEKEVYEISELTEAEQKVVKTWNLIAEKYPNVIAVEKITAKRRNDLQACLKDDYFIKNWKEAMRKVWRSDFLTDSETCGLNWKPTFEWFIFRGDKSKSPTIIKIMEGVYDD